MKIRRILNEIRGRRSARILFLLTIFLLLATIVPPRPADEPRGPASAMMMAAPIPLDEDSPGLRRLGRLVFLRGWQLTGNDPRFGAISAMHVGDGRVTALTDAGHLLRFRLPSTAGALPLRVEPLLPPGTPKRDRDTESLLVHGRDIWIGFERLNAIRRYRDGRLQSSSRPAAMRRWGGNSGAEAMVRLADGRFLVFAEGRNDDAPFSPALLIDGDPANPGTRAAALRYRRLPGFRVTDAALLPDGRLMILNRRFGLREGFAAALTVADTRGLRPGATIVGREVANLPASMLGENLEALSVTREGGRTIVRIASDDNFMPILRTVLLEFAFNEGDGEA